MATDEGTMDYAIGFLLRQAHQRASSAFAEALEPLGISGRHFGVLHNLGRSGPLSQRELVDRVASDKASMVRTVDDLERAGLAARRPTPGDRRVHSVEITDRGREVLATADQTARHVAIRLMDHLDPVKRSQLVELLTEFLQGPGWVKTNR
jgi:DNA-binding MarR family transcriptional regulator